MNSKNLFWLRRRNYIRLLFFFLFANCLAKSSVFAQSYPYKFHYLTVDEGLSHTDANDIAQDRQGYIWIATHFGITRYDGYSVKNYYNSNIPLKNAFKNRVRCLYPDGTGKIWLGTEDGLQCFDPSTEKYNDFGGAENVGLTFEKLCKPADKLLYGLSGRQLKLYLFTGDAIEEQQLNLPQDVLFSDFVSGQNGLLYLSSNKGLWLLDKNRKFKRITIKGITDLDLSVVCFDNDHKLLIAACDQLFRLKQDPEAKDAEPGQSLLIDKQYTLTNNNNCIKAIIQDTKSNYWVCTNTDLVRLNGNLNFIQTVNVKGSLRSLNSNSINKIFIDRSECLWVCTFGGGVNYCDLNEKLFYTLQHNPEVSNSLSDNHVRSILEDGENLWIGTTVNGLNWFNHKTQAFKYYNPFNSPTKIKSNAVTSLTFDNNQNLWIGTGAGIEILKPDRKTLWTPLGYEKFPTHVIDVLVKDYYGNIWFGNHTDRFGVIWKDNLNYYHVKYYDEGYFIFADKDKPQLFVSSRQGLRQFFVDAEGNITRTFSYKASSKPNALSSDYAYPISKQNDSIYWVGTIGGGLNRLSLNSKDNSYQIKSYTGAQGVFNDVESLEIDNAGNIWMGGNGLECLNSTTGKLIRYDKNDGLQGNSFKVGSSYKGADGRLYFGGINGLNYFYPDQIKPNDIAAKPILTSILINNKEPKYGERDSSEDVISQAIGYSNQLVLNYRQNNFVISFSAMHFANPLKCKYRYRLIGYDNEWKFTDGNNPNAAYSNLDYNRYQFVVEATNNDGIWSSIRAETAITVTPPWWKSELAKAIYIILIISSLLGIYIYQARWYRLKRELAVRAVNEKKQEEIHRQREELYQQQLTFFTNVSHEFRTPLSLILGPLESLISQNKETDLNNLYQLMYRNTKRLINLISELMNFKKVEDSIIKLRVQPLLISKFCKDLASEFQELANSKGINFEIIDHTEKNTAGLEMGLLDVQVLEKILFNLLNNSFKYTNSGGEVFFEVFFETDKLRQPYTAGFQLLNQTLKAKKFIYFRVADSGVGISSDSITRIFDRYYRVSNNHLGSGVGLALVKSLTQLHKGNIYVSSERNKGTEITIGVPWGEENYHESEKANAISDSEIRLEAMDNTVLLPLPDYEKNNHRTVSKIEKYILLVDDNQELRAFLKQAFEKQYYVYEAEDGKSAIEMAIEKVPDLIISDVMMPGMNGIEFCKVMKEKFETSHIPFIILSAKDALDVKIEGMESGADFYFAKPLSIDLLLLTIHNIFEQSEKLKVRYTNNYLSEATELVHSEKDKAFLNELLMLIEENIQDPDLDVDFLCGRLYISRTKLYQKIKSISDQSVAEFIRTIRLKKAIQIMTHEDIPMHEVADRIGLQSSSNFSRAFKKEYGKSPIQFIQALRNTKL